MSKKHKMINEWGTGTIMDFAALNGFCASITNQGWNIKFVFPEMSVISGTTIYRVVGERWRELKPGENLPPKEVVVNEPLTPVEGEVVPEMN